MILISYPRSGRHWVTFLIKEYCGFEINSTHNDELKKYDNVIYLYRNPVDVMYSYIEYQNKIKEKQEIDRKINDYFKHLDYHLNKYNKNILVVKYETLREDFPKIIKFLGGVVDEKRIDDTFKKVSKELIQEKVGPKVIRLNKYYSSNRLKFKEEWTEYIINKIPENLRGYFNGTLW